MKRILLIGVLLVACLTALSACNSTAPDEPHTSEGAQTTLVASEEATQAPAEDTEPESSVVSETTAEESTESESVTTDVTEEPTAVETDTEDASVEEATSEGATEETAQVPEETHESLTEAVTEGEITSEEDSAEDGNTAPPEEGESDTLPPEENEVTTEAETEPAVKQPGSLIYHYNESLTYLDNMGEKIGVAFDMGGYTSWKRTVTVGKDQVAVFLDEGWAAFSSTEYQFGYIVNGASYFSDTYAREAETSVKNMAEMMGATNCARFCGGLTVEGLQLGENRVQFCVMLDEGVLCYLREYTVILSDKPVNIDGTYWSVDIDTWTVSGHDPMVHDASNGMVAAGGVDKGALLHQGAVGVGTVDLSKYNKVVVYWGCDASGVTQNHYNNNAHNRVIVTKADSNGKMSPDEKDILASTTYTLHGWRPEAIEIDLTGINYNGPVYITIDSLPGTFVLVSAIEFHGAGKPGGADTPTPPADKDYAPAVSEWTVSGHCPQVVSATGHNNSPMVAAGGVSEGALLHQGAVGVGTVDLSKYSKVIVYYGCDNSQVTVDHYNASPNNRIMLTSVDTNGKSSPDAGDIIAATTYTLRGWGVTAIEIDLTGVSYNGPVYISVDTLPGTFMLISSIEFIV